MNLFQLIATLRKFGNYVVGLFPIFATIGDFLSKFIRKIGAKLTTSLQKNKYWKRLAASPFGQSIWKVFERFYWRGYAKDRPDLKEAHPDSLIILRPLFQLLALLCALIPLTQINLWPTKIEAFSGFTGSAPGWSICLWMLALPCAWAALLAGTAVSNRPAFCLTAVGAAYFLNTCVVLLPRSYFNALSGLAILSSLAYCERVQSRREDKFNFLFGLLNSLIVGAAAGLQIFIMTPLKPLAAQFVNIAGPTLSLGGGVALGMLMGIGVFASVKTFSTKFITDSMGKAVWSIAALFFAYLVAALCRGDMSQTGSLIVSSLALSNNYLWPVWYFLGVGILHKILSSSKVVASAIKDAMPAKFLTPLMLTLLVCTFIILISESAALYFSMKTGPLAEVAMTGFYAVYRLTKPFIWSSPLAAMAAHWTLWVIIADTVIVIVLAFQKRLHSAVLARLCLITVFANFLICEYIFQLSSFMRTPTHSVIALFLFAVWLLWLMHTVGWSLSLGNSPKWPSRGRFAVYGGIAALAIIEISARAASKDFKLMNELFLSMFRGVIDVGLPYYLLVWTSRKLKQMPVQVPVMLSFLILGGIVSLAFNFLDKFATCGWNRQTLASMLATQASSLVNLGSINVDRVIPISWLMPKSLMYVSLLCLVLALGNWLLARSKSSLSAQEKRGAAAILLVAFGSGVASFSKTLIELPIPNEWRIATAPMMQELMFNCNVLQSYLSYWTPAVIMGLAHLYLANRIKTVYSAGIAVSALIAAISGYAISLLYLRYGVMLRSTGSLYLIMTMIAGLFAVLVSLAIQQLDPKEDDCKAKESDALLSHRSLVATIMTLELLALPFAILNSQSTLKEVKMPQQTGQVLISTSWQPQSPEQAALSAQTAFVKTLPSGNNAILELVEKPSNPQGSLAQLKAQLLDAGRNNNLKNLQVVKLESWNQYARGAAACFFSCEGKVPMAGLLVVVPRERTDQCYTLYTDPSEIETAQYDLAFGIQRCAESP